MSELPSPQTFEPYVGSEFAVVDASVAIVLATVTRHAARDHGARRDPFSLLFVGPPGQALPQASYRLDHAALGELVIFIVPIGPSADGRQQYEAVFN